MIDLDSHGRLFVAQMMSSGMRPISRLGRPIRPIIKCVYLLVPFHRVDISRYTDIRIEVAGPKVSVFRSTSAHPVRTKCHGRINHTHRLCKVCSPTRVLGITLPYTFKVTYLRIQYQIYGTCQTRGKADMSTSAPATSGEFSTETPVGKFD